MPADMKVQVIVQPISKRLPATPYNAWREALKDRVEFRAEAPFDKEEMWRIRVLLASKQMTGETDTDVMVTPTLMGRLNLLLFSCHRLSVVQGGDYEAEAEAADCIAESQSLAQITALHKTESIGKVD